MTSQMSCVCVTSFFFTLIFRLRFTIFRSKPGSKNSRKEEADRERKRRTNRMLISMVAVFLLSWLPLNLVNIYNDFHKDMIDWDYYFLSFFLG